MRIYLVTYDICDPRRLRRVFRCVSGWGEHLQLSVFRCVLSPSALEELKASLEPLIDPAADQILLVDLGPAEGAGRRAIEALGLPYDPPDHHALIY